MKDFFVAIVFHFVMATSLVLQSFTIHAHGRPDAANSVKILKVQCLAWIDGGN